MTRSIYRCAIFKAVIHGPLAHPVTQENAAGFSPRTLPAFSGDLDRFQRRETRKQGKIPIVVQDREPVANRTGRN